DLRPRRRGRPVPREAASRGPAPLLRVRPPPAPPARLRREAPAEGGGPVRLPPARRAGPGVPRTEPPAPQRRGPLRGALPPRAPRGRPSRLRRRLLLADAGAVGPRHAHPHKEPGPPRGGPSPRPVHFRGPHPEGPQRALGRRPAPLARP